MKKIIYVCILFVSVIVAFLAGMTVSKWIHNNNVVGVYETDSWNGKNEILVLYEDGTCKYPSAEKATWKKDGETINITIESKYSKQDGSTKGINIIISSEFSEEKIDEILNTIQNISNIAGVDWNEETHLCQITLMEAEEENITSKELVKIEGVSILDYVPEQSVETTYEAKIMESGIVLHGKFFKKVSN